METITCTREELSRVIKGRAKSGWYILRCEDMTAKIYGTWAQVIRRGGVSDSGPMDCTQKACVAALVAAFSWPVAVQP